MSKPFPAETEAVRIGEDNKLADGEARPTLAAAGPAPPDCWDRRVSVLLPLAPDAVGTGLEMSRAVRVALARVVVAVAVFGVELTESLLA